MRVRCRAHYRRMGLADSVKVWWAPWHRSLYAWLGVRDLGKDKEGQGELK